jgi:hypothetical protein
VEEDLRRKRETKKILISLQKRNTVGPTGQKYIRSNLGGNNAAGIAAGGNIIKKMNTLLPG